jgi:hypothetical protein
MEPRSGPARATLDPRALRINMNHPGAWLVAPTLRHSSWNVGVARVQGVDAEAES